MKGHTDSKMDAKLEVLEELIEAMGGAGILSRLEARKQAKAAAPVPEEAAASEDAPKPEDEAEAQKKKFPFKE